MKKTISLCLIFIFFLIHNQSIYSDEILLTRGSFSQLVIDTLEVDVDVSGIENPFTDINPGDDYYVAAVWMYQCGYIGKDPNGDFNSNAKVTNAELATLLTRMVFGNFSVPNDAEIDENLKDHWASKYIWKATESGLTLEIGYWNADAYANESSIDFVLFKELMEKNLSSNTYYTEYHYIENADGSGYSVYEKDYITSSSGSMISAIEKNYIGFTENTVLGVHAGIVREDNTLILSRYYDRNVYEVNLVINTDTSIILKGKYGVEIDLPVPSYNGNVFDGWYSDSLFENKVSIFEMPLNGTTLYANWTQLNTETEYTINRIIMRDPKTYGELSSIPNSNFIAEINITNLSSLDADTIFIVAYDDNNCLKSINYLYTNMDKGKTGVLGTLINNSNGEIAEIKAFIWTSLTSLKPVAEYINMNK